MARHNSPHVKRINSCLGALVLLIGYISGTLVNIINNSEANRLALLSPPSLWLWTATWQKGEEADGLFIHVKLPVCVYGVFLFKGWLGGLVQEVPETSITQFLSCMWPKDGGRNTSAVTWYKCS